MAIEIVAVDLYQMVAISDTGETCSITDMFDDDGEETSDPREARAVVACLDQFNWFSIDLSKFEKAVMN